MPSKCLQGRFATQFSYNVRNGQRQLLHGRLIAMGMHGRVTELSPLDASGLPNVSCSCMPNGLLHFDKPSSIACTCSHINR